MLLLALGSKGFLKHHIHLHVPKDFDRQSKDYQGQQELEHRFLWHIGFLLHETISTHEQAQLPLDWDPKLQ